MSEPREPRIPFVEPPFDPEGLASFFEEGFPLEFCACPSFDPPLVAGLVRAGFIPMATEWMPGRDLLLPKLHVARCILEPGRRCTQAPQGGKRSLRSLMRSRFP